MRPATDRDGRPDRDLPRRFRRLGITAWQLADELGWAKTCDAEYLALGQLLDCRLVTSTLAFGAAPSAWDT